MWILNEAKTFECCRFVAVFLPNFCSSGKQNASQTVHANAPGAAAAAHLLPVDENIVRNVTDVCTTLCAAVASRSWDSQPFALSCATASVWCMCVEKQSYARVAQQGIAVRRFYCQLAPPTSAQWSVFDLFLERGCARDPLLITG